MFHSSTALQFNKITVIPVVNLVEPAYHCSTNVDLAVDSFFMYGLTVVKGVCINHEEVVAKIGAPLNEVSILLQRGKTDEAIQLNYDLLTESVRSLIINALSSA